jgi:tetratricopeptide (TPR) repeat protein
MLLTTLSMKISPPAVRRGVAAVALAGAIVLFPHAPSAHDGVEGQIAQITAQLAREPANPGLLLKRGELYRATRQYPQALADLDRAAALDPNLSAAELARARVRLDAGNPRGAAEAASRFLARVPGHADALVVRARARVRLGQVREAAADFTRALESRPFPDWYVERARAQMASGGDGIGDAIRGLDDGIRRLGPVVTLELEAIDLELRLRRHAAALSRLDRLSAQTPRKESWLARRGTILESAGRIDEARAAYRAALAAASSLPAWTQRAPASAALIERLRNDLTRLDTDSPADPKKRGKGTL